MESGPLPWTSLDAYFHIPINPRSRKCLNCQTYQFTAIPFSLPTAHQEFTKVVNVVKLMAQARGLRIHQYLDWLPRAQSQETCGKHTKTLLALCQDLDWVMNFTQLELIPKQVFNFVGYCIDLSQGLVKPTQERGQVLTRKIKTLMDQKTCSVQQFMSLIGLLTDTEQQVILGHLHEADSVAPEESLACPRVLGEDPVANLCNTFITLYNCSQTETKVGVHT